MGKKMGINTKAVEARERKETQKRAKQQAVERQKEDEYWRDDDKQVNRKINRQKEREIKSQQERDRKAALKAAYEEDMESAEKSVKSKSKHTAVEIPKVTRHEIQKTIVDEQEQLSKQLKKVNLDPLPLVPNLNRLEEDGENASTVDQALDLFKTKSTETSKAGTKSSSKKS